MIHEVIPVMIQSGGELWDEGTTRGKRTPRSS